MHQFLVSAVAFIVIIGALIVVHEFGHYLVAKLCGVRVERFSIGFPPRLFGIQIGETDYCISATLFGGYVKMTGENLPGENATLEGADKEKIEAEKTDPGALTSHPRWQRMLIGVAGPVFNLLLTLALMLFYFGFINEVPAVTLKTATVEWVTPESAAAAAGLKTGDEILSFDGVANPDWEAVYEHSQLNANQMVPVTVERAGEMLQFSLHVPASVKSDSFQLSDEGISPQYQSGPIDVAQVQPGYPAAQAGLRDGDAIEFVDGHAFHSVNTLLAYMQVGQGKTLSLTVLRDGATLEITATPTKLDTAWKLGFAPKPIPIRDEPLALPAAWNKSVGFFEDNSLIVAEVMERLFTHRLSVTQLMGPVGIARVAGEAAEMDGWYPKFGLAAEISLQLGVFNLLPFPILDGGMILFLLIESALRRDISIALKERIYQAAFVVLMAFFAFVIFNDMSKLPLFTHLKP